jgi:hypothetical protein
MAMLTLTLNILDAHAAEVTDYLGHPVADYLQAMVMNRWQALRMEVHDQQGGELLATARTAYHEMDTHQRALFREGVQQLLREIREARDYSRSQ